MDEIVSLCKRRGFIFQGSEIYGGLRGTYDYGPLGIQLKRNITNLWWKVFVEDREDMYGIDTTILMNPQVWVASGHVDTFNDPLVECLECRNRFRVDHLVDEVRYGDFLGRVGGGFSDVTQEIKEDIDTQKELLRYYNNNSDERILDEVEKNIKKTGTDIVAMSTIKNDLPKAKRFLGTFPMFFLNEFYPTKCPNCTQINWGEAKAFNLLFKTSTGSVEDDKNVVYMRGETAQGMFVNFKNIMDSFYPDLPFGIAQIGRNFRNEISPRDFIFRVREFEIAELEYFVEEKDWEQMFEGWIMGMRHWFELIGLPKEKIHQLEVATEDRAHYSKRTVDFEFEYPFGTKEIGGLAYRTDFDLSNHEKHSGTKLRYLPKTPGATPFVPHVIEPTFGVDRMVLAVISNAWREDEVGGEKRMYLALPEHLAPVRFMVSPLLKNKPELVVKAREVFAQLKKKYSSVIWDDNSNVGKRYRRADEIGVPKCITIDFQTLEDDTVTVRDRDTAQQTRVDFSLV
jgi:glycyl-tRNA synthetase